MELVDGKGIGNNADGVGTSDIVAQQSHGLLYRATFHGAVGNVDIASVAWINLIGEWRLARELHSAWLNATDDKRDIAHIGHLQTLVVNAADGDMPKVDVARGELRLGGSDSE